MTDTNTVIEGTVKFRDGKKWKSRWCVMRKLSPVADCLHLQLYRDSKDRYKQGQTKASLSLQHFLGVETGFTLDKESNTIAILCKDVTVVLAFDTRERLIQWQVKIATNLGEDTQFLVQISSAPQKAKIAPGPARLHIQEYRFCITLGVPPRLVGVWEISKLRRYGVVESRFCFEGGSRCGKGEGLYVLVTDQGEEITRTLQCASDGKMTSRRRPLHRNTSVLDSPRKMRPETRLSQLSRADTLSLHHGADTVSCAESISTVHQQHCCCGCRSSTDDLSTIWPSSETRPDPSDFGDTVSVGDISHNAHHPDCVDWSENSMGRCASCISKLGALSRSSTTTANTPGAPHPFSPPWYMDISTSGLRSLQTGSTTCSTISAPSHENSCGSSFNHSDYSAPKSGSESWDMKSSINGSGVDKCPCCAPGRPPKESSCRRVRKPPMPLPSEPNMFENYDVPRNFITPVKEDKNTSAGGDEYYDTPKSIKEVLDQEYGNYDTPPAGLRPACLCNSRPHPTTMHHCTRVVLENEELKSRACPCHRVTCWPTNWLSLPYCRRGNSIEHTSVHLHKVKLSGEGKMPVVNQAGDVAVYATVDMSKKVKYRLRLEDCKEENKENNPTENRLTDSSTDQRPNGNYVNVDVSNTTSGESKEGVVNYENLEFAHSLEYYENARDVLNRSGIVSSDNNRTDRDRLELHSADKDCVKICNKCGHSCSRNDLSKRDSKQDDYLMMGPGGSDESPKCMSRYPGYLPMHPSGSLNGREGIKGPPCHFGGPERASSIPSLASLERCKKQEADCRMSGSAMPGINMCASANSSPYLRRHPMVSLKELQKNQHDHFRKRSCSADSSRFPDEADKSLHTNDSSKNTSVDSIISQACARLPEKFDNVQERMTLTQEALVHVRRSSSVPSKSGNRDSSSSNDSGVSTESFKNRSDFTDFELPLTTAKSTKRHYHALTQRLHGSNDCIHASLPRRSKSSDPLRDLTFHFPKIKVPAKSSSAEAEIPICLNKHDSKDYSSPNGDGALVVPYTDSRSTSSGTSDMSDYIETLSVSSHSSSDTPDSIRLGRIAVTTLRPRSGKEYHKIDRFILDGDIKGKNIISTVPEKSESPSPGYVSGSPGN